MLPPSKQFHDVIRRERFTLKSNLLVVVIDHKNVVNQGAAIAMKLHSGQFCAMVSSLDMAVLCVMPCTRQNG